MTNTAKIVLGEITLPNNHFLNGARVEILKRSERTGNVSVEMLETRRAYKKGDKVQLIASEVRETGTAEGLVRQISCGCCTNGCVCHNHMDIPRGLRPQKCALHSGTGEVVILRA